MEIKCDNHENKNKEMINAPFFSENGEVIDLKMQTVDKDTPINQVMETDQFSMEVLMLENQESTAIDLHENQNQRK